ncbi:sugar transferase [Tropicibacter naphthalenivorans]|uniref:Undecaprenyl phosphate N,N'-diacetylbacillosamine 1-phosphate transferase n=1 Tax=Tropicibacter naphthalenivorans TaxID=441103 RepID=A0A0P1GD74_9RHOB|nr:sugar transferase [Tropicibacter naphthalenivorans]CUH79293.1 Undecaprenyl phosphate N,N'-diacetylbacillosamine 1-phosphate transferase [Tropicibacter naphthalenivorans]SMC71142.1 Sugar transferase involved in LPS biosynthesis (colanic, teichoic acid) [Tropicibacter naphthalenivorans]
MTLHIRQPLPTAKFEALIDEAIHVDRRPAYYRDVFKRVLDVTLVLIAFLPVLMITLVFAALVALDGKSPLYRQERVGRNGRTFYMWKLRSMVPNADRLLEAYLADNPAARAEWDRDQKLRHDPRITKIGHLIRKSSIDELPQLWNVLRGDMSLVGPRPMMPCQQEIYPGTAYYALRPGITGFWQTSVRNESSFAQRAEFDSAYLRKLSFKTDVLTLFKTVRVVIRGTGY